MCEELVKYTHPICLLFSQCVCDPVIHSLACLMSGLSLMAHGDVCLVLTHFRVSMVTVDSGPGQSVEASHTTQLIARTLTSQRPDFYDALSLFLSLYLSPAVSQIFPSTLHHSFAFLIALFLFLLLFL